MGNRAAFAKLRISSHVRIVDSVTQAVMALLNAADVGRCARVSTHWHNLALSDVVWKSLFLNIWPEDAGKLERICGLPASPRVMFDMRFVGVAPRKTKNKTQATSVRISDAIHSANCNHLARGVDWLTRYRRLTRLLHNQKHGRFKETLMIGHTRHINDVIAFKDYVVR